MISSGLLKSDLDRVSSIVAQFFGLGLKPIRSLGVKCARVGFKPILMKARGSRTVGSTTLEFGSGSGSVPGTYSNSGTYAVSGPGSDLGSDSLSFHFLANSVASSVPPPVAQENVAMESEPIAEPVPRTSFNVLGAGSLEVGSSVGSRIEEEFTPKPLIQYKRKLRKSKLAMG